MVAFLERGEKVPARSSKNRKRQKRAKKSRTAPKGPNKRGENHGQQKNVLKEN